MPVTGGANVMGLAVVSNSPTASVQPWYFDDNAVLNPWTGVIPNTHNMNTIKVTIEVEVPEGIDFSHAYASVTDALYLPDNVTQKEFDLVANFLGELERLNQLPPPPDEVHIVI